MKRKFNQILLGTLAILMLESSLLSEKMEAAPSDPAPTPTTYWWEIPAQPPEKWLTPNREDDEWYKRRQMEKYKRKQIK